MIEISQQLQKMSSKSIHNSLSYTANRQADMIKNIKTLKKRNFYFQKQEHKLPK